ncbi:MAG: formylglycine-generating enzyme family protein, partial [Bacteroidia bacterium]
NEKPVHSVTLSAFYMLETEVTQKLWQAVMGNNPSYFQGDNLPVENVSWNDGQVFIQKLNKLTGKAYSLPSEAQWEYAARGGQNFKYAGSNNLDEVAWYYNNSLQKTHPVGQKKANGYGLYDMSGNVSEWCQDYFDDNFYKNNKNTNNPINELEKKKKACRGDSWYLLVNPCRVSNRCWYKPTRGKSSLGFRFLWGTL